MPGPHGPRVLVEPGTEALRRLGFGRLIWRYDLAPAADGGTEVRLTYDWSGATQQAHQVITSPPFGVEHLENSLCPLTVLAAS